VTTWDFFISHAGPDRRQATLLARRLEPTARVFLAVSSLKPGDNWPIEIAKALEDSASVVMVSRKLERAFFQQAEMQPALRLARAEPKKHKVVPVFLGGVTTEHCSALGLESLHGIKFSRWRDLLELTPPTQLSAMDTLRTEEGKQSDINNDTALLRQTLKDLNAMRNERVLGESLWEKATADAVAHWLNIRVKGMRA
jgi:TIR domain